MILFLILLTILVILLIATIVTIMTGGAIFFVLFGDVIVCAFIIAWIFKKIFSKKKYEIKIK